MKWNLHFLLSIAHHHQSRKPNDQEKGYRTGLSCPKELRELTAHSWYVKMEEFISCSPSQTIDGT